MNLTSVHAIHVKNALSHQDIVQRDVADNGRRDETCGDIHRASQDDLALRPVDETLDAERVRLGNNVRNGVRLFGAVGVERCVAVMRS